MNTIAKIAKINTVESAKEFALWADDFAYLCEICKSSLRSKNLIVKGCRSAFSRFQTISIVTQ